MISRGGSAMYPMSVSSPVESRSVTYPASPSQPLVSRGAMYPTSMSQPLVGSPLLKQSSVSVPIGSSSFKTSSVSVPVEGPRIVQRSSPSKQSALLASPQSPQAASGRSFFAEDAGASLPQPRLPVEPRTFRTFPSGQIEEQVPNFSLAKAKKRTSRSSSPAANFPFELVEAGDVDALTREVLAREAKLHALRAELGAKEQEMSELTVQTRDAAVKLQEASGNMDTLSVKVETTAGNRAAVLKASAHHNDSKADTLRRWLAKKEWELVEKDEEIIMLKKAAQRDGQAVAYQQNEYLSLAQQNEMTGEQAAMLEAEQRRVKRHHAINTWSVNVKAQIEQECADVAIQRERRMLAEQLVEVSDSNVALRAFALRMAERCRDLIRELEVTWRRRAELLLQERVGASAEQLGHESAGEQLRVQREELASLEMQMHQEMRRIAASRAKAHEYDKKEYALAIQQEQLVALAACMREIKRVLVDPSMADADDIIETAVQEALEALRDTGMPAPSMLRISHNDYLFGGDMVQCQVRGGSVFVRPPGTVSLPAAAAGPAYAPLQVTSPERRDLVPLVDFLRSWAQQQHAELMPLSPRLLQASAASPGLRPRPAAPTFTPPLIGTSQSVKGLSALVMPLTIGGPSPLVKV